MFRIMMSFIVLLSLDMLWISVIAKDAYFRAYGHILRLENGQLRPIWWAVLLVYVALVGGLNYFAFNTEAQSTRAILTHAFIFGVVVYAVYDFTCLALFKDWPILMTMLDCIWGGVLCGLSAFITLKLETWWFKLF